MTDVLLAPAAKTSIVFVLFWGVCSHLLERFLSWGWARSPPSCSSYHSKAILGSKILAVFHVISPAWGRGKGLTLPINHFFFPPPICSVILLLLHTPLIFDHFYFALILWFPPLFVGSFFNLCPPCSHILAEMLLNDLIFFPSFLKIKKIKKRGKKERKKNTHSSFPSPWTLHIFPVVSTFSQSCRACVDSACFLPPPPLCALPRVCKPGSSSTSFSSSCFHYPPSSSWQWGAWTSVEAAGSKMESQYPAAHQISTNLSSGTNCLICWVFVLFWFAVHTARSSPSQQSSSFIDT